MLRFVTIFGAFALAVAAPQHNIFVTDLDPEEAAKYINNLPSSEPQLSARNAVLPLIKYNDPRFRTAEAGPTLGHYWKNGKEIENPEDYVEEVYNAAQYHGQDGLGAYAYGYKTPESAKDEVKQRSGDVQGAYVYKAGSSNKLIKVRYWADSQGFHQEDNIPKYVPKPVEEAPEVKAARIAHEKAWQEAAYNNLHPGAAPVPQNFIPDYNTYNGQQSQYTPQYAPQPQYNSQQYNTQPQYKPQPQYYNTQSQYNTQPQYKPQPQYNQGQYKYNEQYQGSASEQQSSIVPAPREGKAYYGEQQEYYSTTTTTTTPPPEPTGPPRGFFYSFDYPVSIVVSKSEQQEGSANPGYPLDRDTVSLGQN